MEVEVNGFVKALKTAETIHKAEELLKHRRQRKITELVRLGISRMIAEAMVDSGAY